MVDRIDDPACSAVAADLKRRLREELYGEDLDAVAEDQFIGVSVPVKAVVPNRGLSGQRGLHYPAPPLQDPSVVVGGV